MTNLSPGAKIDEVVSDTSHDVGCETDSDTVYREDSVSGNIDDGTEVNTHIEGDK